MKPVPAIALTESELRSLGLSNSPTPILSSSKPNTLLNLISNDVGSLLEEPRGSNWGNAVKKLLSFVNISFPAPWCAAYVCERLFRAGIDGPKSGWTPTVENWFKTRDKLLKRGSPLFPSIPSVFFLYYPSLGRVGHTGFVIEVNKDSQTIKTIEGNSNADGGREGYAVVRRTRAMSSVYSYGLLI